MSENNISIGLVSENMNFISANLLNFTFLIITTLIIGVSFLVMGKKINASFNPNYVLKLIIRETINILAIIISVAYFISMGIKTKLFYDLVF